LIEANVLPLSQTAKPFIYLSCIHCTICMILC